MRYSAIKHSGHTVACKQLSGTDSLVKLPLICTPFHSCLEYLCMHLQCAENCKGKQASLDRLVDSDCSKK